MVIQIFDLIVVVDKKKHLNIVTPHYHCFEAQVGEGGVVFIVELVCV
jgi:hypothetical protein